MLEIETSHEIFQVLSNGTMDKSFADKRWVSVDDMLKWCNDWYDKKRHGNAMWMLSEDAFANLFLEELEKELSPLNDKKLICYAINCGKERKSNYIFCEKHQKDMEGE